VIRSVPLTMVFEERDPATGSTVARNETSMSVELATRAAATPPLWTSDGRLLLNGRAVASDGGNLLLNFAGGSRDIPTFSFYDLVGCARSGNETFFRQHFAGRVVFVAIVLDGEDRKSTSKRWMTGTEQERVGARCVEQPPERFYRSEEDLAREDIP